MKLRRQRNMPPRNAQTGTQEAQESFFRRRCRIFAVRSEIRTPRAAAARRPPANRTRPPNRRPATPPKAGPGTAGVPARAPPTRANDGGRGKRPRFSRQRRGARKRTGETPAHPGSAPRPCIRRRRLMASGLGGLPAPAPKARTSWVRGRPRPHVATAANVGGRGAMTALLPAISRSAETCGQDARGPGPRLRRGCASPRSIAWVGNVRARRPRTQEARRAETPAVPGSAAGLLRRRPVSASGCGRGAGRAGRQSMFDSTQLVRSLFGAAPTFMATASPPLKSSRVGMPRTW